MSVILVGGRAYAANLRWLERVGRRGTVWAAEQLQRHWFVRRSKHTGFAGLDVSGCPDGLPALSLALAALISGGRWVALVEGAPSGRSTLYVLVKARGGSIPADREGNFSGRAAALEAFERSRSPRWALRATPGLAAALTTATPRSPSSTRTSGNGWICSAAPDGSGWASPLPPALRAPGHQAANRTEAPTWNNILSRPTVPPGAPSAAISTLTRPPSTSA